MEALLPTLIVMMDVPDPGAAMELGLKVTDWAFPCPEADKAIAALKLPETAVVMTTLPDAPLASVIAGEAETVKPAGAAGVTVSETVAVCVRFPSVPEMVML
jgi:hypothetical protein